MLNFVENFICNDELWSRLSRLKDILKWYIGEILFFMLVFKRDGKFLEDFFYNKVYNLFVMYYSDSCEYEFDK